MTTARRKRTKGYRIESRTAMQRRWAREEKERLKNRAPDELKYDMDLAEEAFREATEKYKQAYVDYYTCKKTKNSDGSYHFHGTGIDKGRAAEFFEKETFVEPLTASIQSRYSHLCHLAGISEYDELDSLLDFLNVFLDNLNRMMTEWREEQKKRECFKDRPELLNEMVKALFGKLGYEWRCHAHYHNQDAKRYNEQVEEDYRLKKTNERQFIMLKDRDKFEEANK